MKPIKIIADSTCDLSKELLERFDITICPLYVSIDGKSLADGVDITPDELYEWADKNGSIPRTSAPAPEKVSEYIAPYADSCDIIAFTVSSEMSSAYQNFCLACNDFPDTRITVIDSKSLSSGSGLLILSAAKLIEQNVPYEDIVKKVSELVSHVRAGFIVDSVQYLYKGGRCSALAAFGATALKLHPTLKVEDGFIKVDKKIMGSIRPATVKYAKGLEEGILNADDEMVFITHGGASEEQINDLLEYVKGFNKFKNIYVTRAGCVISSHCGAGTIGILFIAK